MTRTIMLACAGGMSSSLLVTKMQKAAVAEGLDLNIFAVGVEAIPMNVAKKHPEVVLIGPQVHYMLDKVKQKVDIPVEVIDMKNYGTMNGEAVLKQALALMD